MANKPVPKEEVAIKVIENDFVIIVVASEVRKKS